MTVAVQIDNQRSQRWSGIHKKVRIGSESAVAVAKIDIDVTVANGIAAAINSGGHADDEVWLTVTIHIAQSHMIAKRGWTVGRPIVSIWQVHDVRQRESAVTVLSFDAD